MLSPSCPASTPQGLHNHRSLPHSKTRMWGAGSRPGLRQLRSGHLAPGPPGHMAQCSSLRVRGLDGRALGRGRALTAVCTGPPALLMVSGPEWASAAADGTAAPALASCGTYASLYLRTSWELWPISDQQAHTHPRQPELCDLPLPALSGLQPGTPARQEGPGLLVLCCCCWGLGVLLWSHGCEQLRNSQGVCWLLLGAGFLCLCARFLGNRNASHLGTAPSMELR